MHSQFTFNPNVHRTTSNFQQQRGFQQPIYNIGAPPSINFMNHHLVNHGSFTRSFASENILEKRQNMFNVNKCSINQTNSNSSGIIGSFLKHFNKPLMPEQYLNPPPTQHKEFEDFTHMPSLSSKHCNKQNSCLQAPTSQSNLKEQPKSDSSYQSQQSANNNNSNNTTKTRSFMASLFGGSQQQGPSGSRNHRWFRNSFRYRGGSWRSNKNGSKFHDHDVNLRKNIHEKERSYVERDIKDDSSDFVHVVEDDNVSRETTNTSNNPNESAKGSCYTSNAEDPPFMIYSLKEFPAIETSCSNKPTAVETISPAKQLETKHCDHGFVVVPDDATVSTPTFTPKRLSLCEKLIKSPTRLFPTCTPIVLKPCLKAPRRRVSECSDDFIVFADDCEDYLQNDITFSDGDSEYDSEDEDDDADDDDGEEMPEIVEEEDEDMSDSEEDIVNGKEMPEQQVDSGLEERVVRFNLTPKVHVMRVWDYAYRAYRKGDYWQQVGRDHERFKKRISQLQEKLNPILNSGHRERIFRERFEK